MVGQLFIEFCASCTLKIPSIYFKKVEVRFNSYKTLNCLSFPHNFSVAVKVVGTTVSCLPHFCVVCIVKLVLVINMYEIFTNAL